MAEDPSAFLMEYLPDEIEPCYVAAPKLECTESCR
jgi:hypothetical protein